MNDESTRSPSPASPKRRFGPATLLFVAVISAAFSATAVAVFLRQGNTDSASSNETAEASLYMCPMHPSIVQDHPADCPICGMKLIPMPGATKAPQATKAPERTIRFYRSPMDPTQTSPTPRKDEMGMDYLPVYEDEVNAAPELAGLAAVDIDPARQQLIGLRTVEAAQGPVGGSLRAVGRIAIDETRVRHVSLKIGGFIERIHVDFVGKSVRRGDPLFSMYSPELLAAQEEYLLALRARGGLEGDGGGFGGGRDHLLASARRRLELWDVSPSTIDRLGRTGEPMRALMFYSPISGVVTRKDVVQGMRLEAGAMPYEIVDLSSVWVLAEVYESELRFVRARMAARLHLEAFPNREFTGAVAFVDPLLNPQSRTLTVRMSFPNPTGELRPGMFGEVVLEGEPHEGLRIPPDAVIDSGTQKIVFVAVGEGRFQPREVRLGDIGDAHVEVISGLSAGDRVVTRANFLIDSESRLRASLAEMSAGTSSREAPESARVLPGGSQP